MSALSPDPLQIPNALFMPGTHHKKHYRVETEEKAGEAWCDGRLFLLGFDKFYEEVGGLFINNTTEFKSRRRGRKVDPHDIDACVRRIQTYLGSSEEVSLVTSRFKSPWQCPR